MLGLNFILFIYLIYFLTAPPCLRTLVPRPGIEPGLQQ